MKLRLPFLPLVLLLILFSATGTSAQDGDSSLFLPLVSRYRPEVTRVVGPLLVDGEQGRIYTMAELDGTPSAVALATEDGRLLQIFNRVGALALDRIQQRLLVDQGSGGVQILDALTGAPLGEISLAGEPAADPQIDPSSGRAFLFRDSAIHMFNLESQELIGTVPLSQVLEVCGEAQGPAPISRSYYDLIGGVLYVSATTYVCTPHMEETIASYSSDLQPLGAFAMPERYQAVPFAGNLYGTAVLRGYNPFGLSYWALNATQKWYDETIAGVDAALKGIVVDWQRNLLYEALWAYSSSDSSSKFVRVSQTVGRTLRYTVPWGDLGLGDAQLVAHDPHTDQLYFLQDGKLQILPTAVLLSEELLDFRAASPAGGPVPSSSGSAPDEP